MISRCRNHRVRQGQGLPRSAVAGWRGISDQPLEPRFSSKRSRGPQARRFAPLLTMTAPQPSAGELGLAQCPNLHPPPRHGSHPYH
jgi:hypothetical protein